MSAFHFKELATQPALGDSIELREPGTATPITGQVTDVSGGNLSNPFLVSAAGVEGDWAFVAPDDVPYDVYWVEDDNVIGKSQEERGAGGGGGIWENIHDLTLTTDATDVVFTGLDFDTYDYRLRLKNKVAVSSSFVHFYTTEADAATAIATKANYTHNSFSARTTVTDSQALGSRFLNYASSSIGREYFSETTFTKLQTGEIGCMNTTCTGLGTATPGFVLACSVYNPLLTSGSTQLGFYAFSNSLQKFSTDDRFFIDRTLK